MHSKTCVVLALALCSIGIVECSDADTQIDIWTKNGTRNATAPLLGGVLFEDIAHSGDGGIYGELIRNRAFQGSDATFAQIENIPYESVIGENPILPFAPTLHAWHGLGDVRLSLDLLHPLSDDLQVSLQVDVLLNATGTVGFYNDGWWGIDVSPQTYDASFYVQPDGVRFNNTITHVDVCLADRYTGHIWGWNYIPIVRELTPSAYQHFKTQIHNQETAPNTENIFTVTFDAAEAAGQTLYFNLISLYPETYKNRKNGLRKDLAQNLHDLNAKFLRFPGGNNLEGYSVQRRWKWWKTIGPLEGRPGRVGDWSYYNTDGLGLLEYLIWCEDMNWEPLLAVYDGFSLDQANYDTGNSTDDNEYLMRQMGSALQEALDELEYCTGSVYTYWGRQRALHGHPEPFKINMIQIGNEGFFSHRYPERSRFMYEGLRRHYPDATYVFSAFKENAEFIVKIPPGQIWDNHIYAPFDYFINNFNFYDHFREQQYAHDISIGLMEYHVSQLPGGVKNTHPRMGAAVAEAVYAIAGERNPDVLRLSCFAPVIQNRNFYRETPYNILFTADPKQTVLSTSYYQQQMFNTYPGTQTLPVTVRKGQINPLFWVASIDQLNNAIYLKVVNSGSSGQVLEIGVDDRVVSVNGTILQPPTPGDMYAYNDIGNATIIPRPFSHADLAVEEVYEGAYFARSRITWSVPGYSIQVVQLDLALYREDSGYGGDHGDSHLDEIPELIDQQRLSPLSS